MKRTLAVSVLWLFAMLMAYGQKPEPTTRKLDVQPSSAMLDSASTAPSLPLPKLDLPEYIITGIASIDLPTFEKEMPDEHAGVWGSMRTMIGTAERGMPHLSEPERKQFLRPFPIPLYGSVRARFGSYSTPALDVWVGRRLEQLEYSLWGNYFRTGGYVPGADRTSAEVGGNVRFALPSGPDVGLLLVHEPERYHFFGSVRPLARRTITTTRGGVYLTFPEFRSMRFTASLEQADGTVKDSSSSVTEHISRVRLEGIMPAFSLQLRGGLQYESTNIERPAALSISHLKIFVATNRYWWRSAFLEGSLAASFSRGSGRAFSLGPGLAAGYRLDDRHLFTAGIRSFRTLEPLHDHLRRQNFLSAQTAVAVTDTRVEGTVVVESQWLPWLTSKVTAVYALVENEPRSAETAATGVWVLKTDGTTRHAVGTLELFANVTANDYFGVVLFLQSVSNAGRAVPYLPFGELSATYTRGFPFGLVITPELGFRAKRWTDESRSQSLPGYAVLSVEARYEVMRHLSVVVRAENLTDTRYELWKGYRAEPFMVHAGMRYAW